MTHPTVGLVYQCAFILTVLASVLGCTADNAKNKNTDTSMAIASSTLLSDEQAKNLGNVFIRGSNLPYHPARPKEFVVMSHSDIHNQAYQVTNTVTSDVIFSGKIPSSRHGVSDFTPFAFNYTIDLSHVKEEGQYVITLNNTQLPTEYHFSIAQRSIDHPTRATEILTHFKSTRSGTSETLYHKASHLQDKKALIIREADKATEVPHSFQSGVDHTLGLYTTDRKYVWKSTGRFLDMSGGWYDAGDYIKFTLTNAVSAYYLLEAYQLNPEFFDAQRVLSTSADSDIIDEIKHGLSYLLKVFPDDNTFIMQVGSEEDHRQGLRLPTDDHLTGIERPAFTALVPQHMGITAAALAKGFSVFKKVEPERAQEYLDLAIKLWNRARKDDVLNYYPYDQAWFYNDPTANDNLALAGIELFHATGKKDYLSAASEYAAQAGIANNTSWASYQLAANLHLSDYDTQASSRLNAGMASFLAFANSDISNSQIDDGNIWGRPARTIWAGLYNELHVAAVAAVLSTSSESDFTPLYYNVIDYLFGRNNWGVSFLSSQKIPNSVTQIYSQIYSLQPSIYPTGAISEGPVNRTTHEANKKYFPNAETIQQDLRNNPFNTREHVFIDNNGNYATMETTIFGQAVGLYLITASLNLEKALSERTDLGSRHKAPDTH